MGKYARQVIVQVACDRIIREGAGNLVHRANDKGIPTQVADLPITDHPDYAVHLRGLRDSLAWLAQGAGLRRLYIDGHGDWANQRVAGQDAAYWANTLIGAGLQPVDVCSVLACEVGLGRGWANHNRILGSAHSFAAQLHRLLRNIAPVVYARVYNVGVSTGEIGDYRGKAVGIGKKVTRSGQGDDYVHYRPDSKIAFTWAGNVQQHAYVDQSTERMLEELNE